MRRTLWAVIIAVPLVTLLALGFGHNPNASGSPLLNHPAPPFKLQTLSGQTVSLASLRGKPVLLNFWASWCTSCRAEHPYLMSAWKRYASRGVVFLGVDFRDESASAMNFLKQHGVPWAGLKDPGDDTAVNYGVTGIPETFLIDRRGVIRYHFPGPVDPSTLNRELQRLAA